MEKYTKSEIFKGRLKFIIMSLLGIMLFLVPVPVTQDGKQQTTLLVAFLAGWLKDVLGPAMPYLILIVITLSGI
ncbi:MAG: YjiH family protein, partial [Staphylococcus simulans]|nr:YjiH family protein [Staphylococcus simulans]